MRFAFVVVPPNLPRAPEAGLHLRRATAEDAGHVASLFRAARPDATDRCKRASYVHATLQRREYEWFVALHGGRVVGALALPGEGSGDLAARHVVDPAYRGMGLGDRLRRFAAEAPAAKPIERLRDELAALALEVARELLKPPPERRPAAAVRERWRNDAARLCAGHRLGGRAAHAEIASAADALSLDLRFSWAFQKEVAAA